MRRGAKPGKAKIKTRLPVARKPPKNEAPGRRDLEKRLAEALEQQTATSEVLRVISHSPTNIQPVLDAVAESAARLCEAQDAGIFRRDGDRLLFVAHHGPIPFGPVGEFSIPLVRGTANGRSVLDAQTIHVADLQTEVHEYPEGSEGARRFGHRTFLIVPLMREGVAIGSISLRRIEAQLFTDRQVALLQTFADQAVIAIENVRLFTELQERNRAVTQAHAQVTEALEQQTATAEILRVIGTSPMDAQPVFDAIARSGVRVCGAQSCTLFVVDGDMLRVAATHGVPAERVERFRTQFPMPLRAENDVTQVLHERCIFHLVDIEHNPAATPEHIENARLGGYRTRLMVPMLRGDSTLGLIAVTHQAPTPFSDQQIALLHTFADQAVIATDPATENSRTPCLILVDRFRAPGRQRRISGGDISRSERRPLQIVERHREWSRPLFC
jgi:GAF domain-containing protein